MEKLKGCEVAVLNTLLVMAPKVALAGTLGSVWSLLTALRQRAEADMAQVGRCSWQCGRKVGTKGGMGLHLAESEVL